MSIDTKQLTAIASNIAEESVKNVLEYGTGTRYQLQHSNDVYPYMATFQRPVNSSGQKNGTAYMNSIPGTQNMFTHTWSMLQQHLTFQWCLLKHTVATFTTVSTHTYFVTTPQRSC